MEFIQMTDAEHDTSILESMEYVNMTEYQNETSVI